MPMMVNEGGKKAAKFPEKSYTKHIPAIDGAGEEGNYPDTEPLARKYQEESIKKAKSNGTKPGYRN